MKNLLCFTCRRMYDGSCPGWIIDDELWTGKCKYYQPINDA